MKVWLDDERPAPKGWILVDNYWDAKDLLEKFGLQITHMSFDHDLGSGCPTGYDLASSVEEMAVSYPPKINKDILFYVHSANPSGAKQIQAALNSALKFMGRAPRTIRCDASFFYAEYGRA